METVYFTTQEFFLTSQKRHSYEWKLFPKDRPHSCQWKLIFQRVETIFFHCLRYLSRSSLSRLVETHFSVQQKKLGFLHNTFFPAGGNHYLNYTEAYLKLLSLLLKMLFDFSSISANVSRFFVQWKLILKQILHFCQRKSIFCLLETVFFYLEIFICY